MIPAGRSLHALRRSADESGDVSTHSVQQPFLAHRAMRCAAHIALVAAIWLACAPALAQPSPEGDDTLTASLSVRLASAQQMQRWMHARVDASRYELRGVASPDPLAGDRPGDFRFVPGPLSIGQGGWLTGNGRFTSQSGGGVANDVDADTFGVTAGWDGRLGHSVSSPWSRVRLGGAFSWQQSSWRGKQSPSRGEAQSFALGVHGSWSLPRFYTSIAGQYAYELIDTQRTLTGGTTTRGKPLGSTWGASIEVGGLLGEPESGTFRPVAAFDYNGVVQRGFAEDGGPGLAYEVARATVTSLQTRLGASVARQIPLDPRLFGSGTAGEFGIEPEAHAYWLREWGDLSRDAVLVDVGGGPVVVRPGATAGRDSFLVGAGYTMRIAEVALVQAGYDAHLSSDRVAHLVRGTLILTF